MLILPDVLTHELAVVFCGTAVGKKSEKRKAYYAGGANKFWHTLHKTGLTPRLIRPEEFDLVLAYDIGLTDLAKGRAAPDEDLTDDDYDVPAFVEKIVEHEPETVAFNGKEAARRALGRATVDYGLQPERIGGAMVRVLPSTSWRGSSQWDETCWVELADAVRSFRRR